MNKKDFKYYFGRIFEMASLDDYNKDPEFKSLADRLIEAATAFMSLLNDDRNPNRLDFAKGYDDKADKIEVPEGTGPEEKTTADFINTYRDFSKYLKTYANNLYKQNPDQKVSRDSLYADVLDKDKGLISNIKKVAAKLPELDSEKKALDQYEKDGFVYISDDMFSKNVFSQKSTDKEKLISVDIFPNDGPKPEDVIQKQNGACFLLSSVRMMADADPQSIRDLIEDNGDGTVTVHFNITDENDDLKKKPFNVVVDKTVADWDQKSAPWVKLVEKAFAAANINSSLEFGGTPDINALKSQSGIDIKERIKGGGDPWGMMSLISPKIARSSTFKEVEVCSEPTKEGVISKLAENLKAAFDNKQPVSVNFAKPTHAVVGTGIVEKKGKPYLEYYDQQAQKTSTISLEDLFENKNSRVMGVSIFPRPDTKDYLSYCHVFAPQSIKSDFEKNNRTVTKDNIKDALADEFKKRTDVFFQKDKGHHGFTELQLANFLKKDDAFFDAVFEKLDKNMRLGDFRKEIAKPDSELIMSMADKYKGMKPDYKTDEGHIPIVNFLSKGREVFRDNPALEKNGPENTPVNNIKGNAADVRLAKMAEARKSIKEYAKYLEGAKTFKNSDEYRDLITTMNTIGDDKSWRNMRPEVAEKLFANQLTSIYSKVDKYLDHKSKDGVNKNAYKKLYAVEKTSMMLKDVMKDFGDQQVTIGSTQLNLSNIAVDYKQQAALYNEKFDTKMPAPKQESRKTYEDSAIMYMAKNEGKLSSNLTREKICDVIENVDTCMCRIILKAQKNNQSLKSIKTLSNLRQDMIKEPFPPIKDAPEVSNEKEINQNIL